MKTMFIPAAAILSLAFAVPATAQMSNSHDTANHPQHPHMSPADEHTMQMCNAMTHDEMTKHPDCVTFMHDHPGMMHHTPHHDAKHGH